MKIMKYFLITSIATVLMILSGSCKKHYTNPNIPDVNINITIDPNSTLFYELNTAGGWCYLDNKPGVYIPLGSRGIIVYRQDMKTFLAYERTPPNEPYKCCSDDNNNCEKLVVDDYFPFVYDKCTDISYSILDGTIFQGEGIYSLIQYKTSYDGGMLHIYN
jgi:hypothetical protein